MAGSIVLCPTPLGNLEDITLRTIRTLRECDAVFAEDTRVAHRLLRHLNISKPLHSFHEGVERARLATLRTLLGAGKKVALVTDAGMPGISDPGVDVVRAAREAGARVELLPGPSAALAAIVLSGFDGAHFRFDGFPPRKVGERQRYLAALRDETLPVVWFESTHRVLDLLRDVALTLPTRRLFVLREYTKKFEQHIFGDAAAVIAQLTEVRGEFSLVLDGAEEQAAQPLDSAALQQAAGVLRAAGAKTRDIVEALRLATGRGKNELYRIVSDDAPQGESRHRP
ncbi:MAG: 16S rRNA (cytidine(1402)-2'-O)-methyltransferase [Candidatus Eremiobacteraeota bacterium]|nr:16S rRNA (cytidine(1402)-2'-O)-methyltransferase [Candidatus Eremiobacteraeota bacterium]